MFKTIYKYKKSVLITWTISFVIILVIPLISGVMFYNRTENIVKNEARNYAETFLWQMQTNIENIAKQVNLINSQISESPAFKEQIRLNDAAWNLWNAQRWTLSEKLKDCNIPATQIYDLMIYFPERDYCATLTSAMDCYEYYKRHYPNGDYDGYQKWKERVFGSDKFSQYAENMMLGEYGTEDVVLFVQPLPLLTRDTQAYSVSIIRTSALLGPAGKSDTVFIAANSQGEVMLNSSDIQLNVSEFPTQNEMTPVKIDGKSNYIISTHVSVTNWKLYSVMFMDNYYKELRNIRSTMLVAMLLYIIISGLMAAFLIGYNYYPLKNIVSNINRNLNMGTDYKKNEYSIIEDVFSKTIEDINTIQGQLKKQTNILRDSFLSSILRGTYKGNVKNKFQEYGIQFLNPYFVVVIFDMDNPEDIFADKEMPIEERIETGRFIIHNIMEELIGEKFNAVFTEINNTVVGILNPTETEHINDELKSIVNYAREIIYENFELSFVTVVSAIHPTDIGISSAYSEANDALAYKILYDAGALIFCSEIENVDAVRYYFPLEKEQQLINYVRSGNSDGAVNLVNEIFDLNFKKQLKPIVMVKCLIMDIGASVLKSADKIFGDSNETLDEQFKVLEQLNDANTIYEIQQLLTGFLEQICSQVKENNSRNIDEAVIAFIEENYSNTQLTVAAIAEHMKLKPSYLSSAFKSKTGSTPLEYIMRFRIEKSKELMDGDYSMEAIAQMVGYDNYRTFARIFKNLEGVSPSQYRKE